jgi:hypothetical protein
MRPAMQLSSLLSLGLSLLSLGLSLLSLGLSLLLAERSSWLYLAWS